MKRAPTTVTYNFSPGPALIPQAVHEAVRADLAPTQGVPVLEMGHRTPEFEAMAERSREHLRKLLGVPSNYRMLFVSGGARAQYAMVPINCASRGVADYFDTGHWSRCARDEAKRFTDTHIVAEVGGSQRGPARGLPDEADWSFSPEPSYVHYVDNETLSGFETPADFAATIASRAPQCDNIACDMTSNLLSRPFDVSRYGVVYAAAQKNIGIAGLTVVIIREDLCKGATTTAPSLYDYASLAESDSLLNTPPVFAWHVAEKVLEWTLGEGGVAEMDARCRLRSGLIYECVDGSDIYLNDIDPRFRSRVNVAFGVKSRTLLKRFLESARDEGFYGLQGHRAEGGVRASMYNAMPLEGARALAERGRQGRTAAHRRQHLEGLPHS